MLVTLVLAAAAAGLAVYVLVLRAHKLMHEREAFIRAYAWPPGLLDKLKKQHPYFRRKEEALVAQGLRHFFLAYLRGGRKSVAMPSQVVDDLWHEFILYTRSYGEFCEKAFGTFLHHTPAAVLARGKTQSNEGLRRVWWWCCKEESIDPNNPTRLPLLFALDKKLNIRNGYYYTTDCAKLRRDGLLAPGTQCADDFANAEIDGSTSGMGDGGSGVDASGGDSGGSDGGGCGGGD